MAAIFVTVTSQWHSDLAPAKNMVPSDLVILGTEVAYSGSYGRRNAQGGQTTSIPACITMGVAEHSQ